MDELKELFEELRGAIAADESAGEPVCCTADVAVRLLAKWDEAQL